MVKKGLSFLACILFFYSNTANAQSFGTFNPQNMSYSNNGNYYQNNDCTDYPVVSGLERNIIGNTFKDENIYQRVNRLESTLLGVNFSQEALCDRIDRIKKAASSNDSYAYNSYNQPTSQQYRYQSMPSSPWQSMSNGFSNNSSDDNQYYNASQKTSGLQKVLEFAIPIISTFAGNNFESNNYVYSPGYQQDYNRYQNLNYGAGVRIIP